MIKQKLRTLDKIYILKLAKKNAIILTKFQIKNENETLVGYLPKNEIFKKLKITASKHFSFIKLPITYHPSPIFHPLSILR